MLDRTATRLGATVIVLAVFAGAPLSHARAQEIRQGIAAVVNEDVVSIFDMLQRLRLIILSTGVPDTPGTIDRIGPQVLQTLIDERLRLQEAARYNIVVSEQDMADAIAVIEQRNGIEPGGLESFMRSRGIIPETVLNQIRAQITWQRLVGQRMRSSIIVSDDEIDEAIERFKSSQGVMEFLVSQIFLPVESSDVDEAVFTNASEIVEQVRSGIGFAELARQFSSGATASDGGRIGWLLREQVPDEVGAALDSLPPDGVSDPIRAGGGYLVVYLHERRVRSVADPGDVRVGLKQILLPLAESADGAEVEDRLAMAEKLRARLGGCADMDSVAAEIDPSMSGDLGLLRIGDLPGQMREAVEGMEIGAVSTPLRTSAGVHLLMVCERIEPVSTLPDRETVRDALIARRFEQASRRYLRDIRRNAFVEIRI